MQINKQISNILYSLDRFKSKSNHNILYNRASSFFDAAILEIPNDKLNFVDMAHNDSLLNKIPYSAIWINDVINYSQYMAQFAEFYAPQMFFIHSQLHNGFKKEDLTILRTNLNKHTFISFNTTNNWPFDQVMDTRYGLVKPKNTIAPKTKDILIINIQRQKQMHTLYHYLKSMFPSTDILEQQSSSIEFIHNLLSDYKVCIDFDNYYNLLVANSCNTIGITNMQSCDEHIHTISDAQQLISILPDILNVSKDTDDISENIINKYNWNEFCNNIYNYFLMVFNQGFTV